MSQNDMSIANQGFPALRADLNAALQALASTSSGSSRPSTAYAGQLWLDTNTPSATVWSLFLYDGSDDIFLGHVDSTNNVFGVATAQAANVASASTIDLDAAYGMVVDVTGTTTITAVTLSQGRVKVVRFTGALTLTHGASLVLPGGANITTAAGDYAVLVGYAAGVVRCAAYTPVAPPPPSESTWTPAFLSTGASFAYAHQVGSYARSGKLVHLEFRLALSGAPTGTTTNPLNITGLPFACKTVSNLYLGGHLGHYFGITLAAGTTLAWQGQSGGTTLELKEVGGNLGETTVPASALGSAAEIRGSLTYISA